MQYKNIFNPLSIWILLLGYFVNFIMVDSVKGANNDEAYREGNVGKLQDQYEREALVEQNVVYRPENPYVGQYDYCFGAVSSPDIDVINRLFFKLSHIIGYTRITPQNGASIKEINTIIELWLKEKVLPIEDLLQIAYFLDITPATFLSTQDLVSQIEVSKLAERSFMPEVMLQRQMKQINRALRKLIKEITSELSFSFRDPDFTLSDVANIIRIPIQDLEQMQSSNFVPHYLQMRQILNATHNGAGMSMIDFFQNR